MCIRDRSVAVLMDGMVKTYNVTPSTADPTSATLTSTDPYYWTNHNDKMCIRDRPHRMEGYRPTCCGATRVREARNTSGTTLPGNV